MPTVTTGRTIRTNHDRENPYFMLARATAQDKGISYEALGILTYLLSQSDRWEINVSELAKRGRGGKGRGLTRIYRILKELREQGYITLEREYVKGKISHWIYQVYERPIDLLNQNLQVEKLNVENDSSNKDKEVPENTKEKDSAPQNGAGGVTGFSVKEKQSPTPKTKKTPKPPVAPSPLSPAERDALFNAVILHVFKIASPEEFAEAKESDNAGTRAGMISNWLAQGCDKIQNKKVGRISRPATPEHVQKFAAWYATAKPRISIPKDAEKFIEAWREWASLKHVQDSQRQQRQQPQPDRPTLTDDQLKQRQADIAARRNGVTA